MWIKIFGLEPCVLFWQWKLYCWPIQTVEFVQNLKLYPWWWKIEQLIFSLCSWYFGEIKRPEAEKLLKTPPNEHGAFLVRDSDKGGFALSMRDGDMVKHYKIRTSENGDYFIAHNNQFSSLSELIQHYSTNADGLCDCLKSPCIKVFHIFHWWDA